MAKHLGTGRLKPRAISQKMTEPFTSLQDADAGECSDFTRSKHGNVYISATVSRPNGNVVKAKANNSTSNSADGPSMKGCAPIKNPRNLSADEFMRQVHLRKSKQLNVSASSGEGHCSGACAMIPADIRPLIKQAYDNSDFDHVDTNPVCLPMVGDDGVIRRERTTCLPAGATNNSQSDQ